MPPRTEHAHTDGPQTTASLRDHLEDLQRRNRLLRELRAAQLTSSSSNGERQRHEAVMGALMQAKETGPVTNGDLERIVDLARVARPSANHRNSRCPLAAGDVNQGPAPKPRLKLKLSEIAPAPQQSHTAREPRANPQRNAEAAATARDFHNSRASGSVTERAANAAVGGVKASRYHTLLAALNLEAGFGENDGNDGLPIIPCPEEPTQGKLDRKKTIEALKGERETQLSSDAAVEPLASAAAAKANEPEVAATRPRCHSAPLMGASTLLQEEARARLKAEGGAGRRSLPGSPRWTDDMNPSHQPDGMFSREKIGIFERGVRNLLRTARFGGTLLETKVEAKRSKHTSQLWMNERSEEAKNPNFCRTNMYKTAVTWKQSQCSKQSRRQLQPVMRRY